MKGIIMNYENFWGDDTDAAYKEEVFKYATKQQDRNYSVWTDERGVTKKIIELTDWELTNALNHLNDDWQCAGQRSKIISLRKEQTKRGIEAATVTDDRPRSRLSYRDGIISTNFDAYQSYSSRQYRRRANEAAVPPVTYFWGEDV